MTLRRLAISLALMTAARASAQTFPARSGELGILDVPDAEIAGPGRNHLGAELRFDHVAGRPNDFGPLPAYAVIGLTEKLDLGLTMREWGEPNDPPASRVLFGAAAKLQLWRPQAGLPGLAVSTTLDRVNQAAVYGARLAASTSDLPVRFAALAGFEYGTGSSGKTGAEVGLGLTIPIGGTTSFAAEALTGPRGSNFGGAFRWELTRTSGVSLGLNYLPKDDGLRVSLGFAFWPARAPRAAATPEPVAAPVEEVATSEVRLTEDRPRFRLRMPSTADRMAGGPRHLQYGTPAEVARGADRPTAPVPAAVPSLDALADAQLAEQEAFAEGRERRVRSTSEQLAERERAVLDQSKQLEERERKLAERERQLAAREQRLPRGVPSPELRQLESVEAQLATQERNLAAQEHAFGPAIDAATGREQDAAARESAERQEASRLAASVTGASTRAQQLEVRKQALGARNRQLAALEVSLVARGERVDAQERMLRAKDDRLDTWGRRLDTRGERLDHLERLGNEPQQPKGAAAPQPAGSAPTRAGAVVVMVVKSPSSIVKEAGSGAPVQAIQTGAAVETAVAAATIATFATPAATLAELDREAIEKTARVAAAERCELLIWARAKDPSLMGEAQRRVAEIKGIVLAAAKLSESQVVTRITTRPGAQGVDVVVSALRATAKAAPAPAAAAAAGTTGQLEAGEGGKRQIREAVQAAQASIEACVGEQLERRNRTRGEGLLRLGISSQGRVTKVSAIGDDFATPDLDACLGRASSAWTFPGGDSAYAVDVPITVVRGGVAR